MIIVYLIWINIPSNKASKCFSERKAQYFCWLTHLDSIKREILLIWMNIYSFHADFAGCLSTTDAWLGDALHIWLDILSSYWFFLANSFTYEMTSVSGWLISKNLFLVAIDDYLMVWLRLLRCNRLCYSFTFESDLDCFLLWLWMDSENFKQGSRWSIFLVVIYCWKMIIYVYAELN